MVAVKFAVVDLCYIENVLYLYCLTISLYVAL